MDVILSIVAGLGLRIFLITDTRDKLTAALLGIWEGVIVHQLSARSRSSHLDHVLAYVLRLVADLLISKNFLRLFMVLLWTAFGSIISEAVSPHASLRSASRRRRDREKERERERERRHRHSQSSSEDLAILSTPPPLRVRTSIPPHSDLHPLLSQPPQQSSPPLISSFPPQTPPSLFLHGTSDIDSPSPKPVHLQLLQPADSATQDSLPVRPRSGLASILERTPNPPTSLLNDHNLLPTPPESSQSAIPSDAPDVQNNSADVHDTTKILSRLSPIAEQSSPDSTATETVDYQNKTENKQPASTSPLEAIVSLPVFNMMAYSSFPLLTSHFTKQNHDEIFTTPFSPTMSPAAPIPVPIPRRNRQDPLGKTHATLRNDLNTDHENDNSSDSDELQTPGLRDTLNAETDNDNDDPLLTPTQMKSAEEALSPLGLNVISGLGTDNYIHLSNAEGGSSDPLPDTLANNEVLEELHVPGSLSQNLLQVPSESFPPSASPVPPSPSTICSDTTMLSQLSSHVPSKLSLKADNYRRQAREEEQSRGLLENERKVAEAQGRSIDAFMLNIRLKELDERVWKLDEKASRRYYAAHNPLERDSRIDLHGLRPKEAFVRVERALVKAIKEGRKNLYLIVGQGKHSINGKPVLKRTVQNEIIRNGFRCEVHERNPGVLVVTLPPPPPP